MKKIISILLTLIIYSTLLSGCNKSESISDSDTISKTDFFFDTVITITLYDSNDESIIDSCFEQCSYYEQLFSKTISDSEISLLNRNGKLINANEHTLSIVKSAIHFSELTNGVFDITIAPISSLWDFRSDSPTLPDTNAINNALKLVDYKNIKIENNDITFLHDGMSIDLGGIAKGYIADQLVNYLQEKGVSSAIISLGGNIYAMGCKSDSSAYNIGIQKPFASQNETCAVINISNKSVVTSGVYERYFYLNNNLYHHILDTSTGYPINNGLLSVTIISDSSLDGDALSTGIFALGLDKGMSLINSLDNIEAVFVDSNNNIHISQGLKNENNIITLNN